MKIYYGTRNKGKLLAMSHIVKKLPFEILSLPDEVTLTIDENGDTPLENARIKALAYYSVLKQPVLSFDSGLYFDEVSDSEQPKTRVRRQNGKEMTDDEMVEHYSQLACKYGGRLTARYKNAMSLVIDEDTIFEGQTDYMESEPFYIVENPHPLVEEGFPLNRLSVEMNSMEYYNDLTRSKYSSKGKSRFEQFFIDFLAHLEE